MCLNVWSPAGGTVLRGCGTFETWKKVDLTVWGLKFIAQHTFLSYLYFLFLSRLYFLLC